MAEPPGDCLAQGAYEHPVEEVGRRLAVELRRAYVGIAMGGIGSFVAASELEGTASGVPWREPESEADVKGCYHDGAGPSLSRCANGGSHV